MWHCAGMVAYVRVQYGNQNVLEGTVTQGLSARKFK